MSRHNYYYQTIATDIMVPISFNNTFLTLFLLFTNTFCIMSLVSGIIMKIF